MRYWPALLLFTALLAAGGCSSAPRGATFDPIAADQKFQSSYRRQFARFAVSPTELPSFNRKEFLKLSRRLPLTATGLPRLELQLGARRGVASNSIYRTESYYRLMDGTGRLLATAESTLALSDLSPFAEPEIVICSDPVHQTYLIAEEQSWGTHRYILMTATAGSHDHQPGGWRVVYLRMPERGSAFPPGTRPHILGLHADHVYLQQDGSVYAFPLKTLEVVSDLNYSIG